jgi:ABC-type multidrug transport system fused ATPase/permease subunit
LTGSLRKNLDLFEQYDDATLNSALRAAGLFALQNEMDEGKITLDSEISAGGGNLSVGQRQILALGSWSLVIKFCSNFSHVARAIVRGSKLLILDEATSAIGNATHSRSVAVLTWRQITRQIPSSRTLCAPSSPETPRS